MTPREQQNASANNKMPARTTKCQRLPGSVNLEKCGRKVAIGGEEADLRNVIHISIISIYILHISIISIYIYYYVSSKSDQFAAVRSPAVKRVTAAALSAINTTLKIEVCLWPRDFQRSASGTNHQSWSGWPGPIIKHQQGRDDLDPSLVSKTAALQSAIEQQ